MRRSVKVLGMVAVVGLAAAAQAHGGPMGPPPGGMCPGGGPQMGGPGGPGGQQGGAGGNQGGPQGGQPPAPDAHHVAHMLARAADADKSGGVTAAEWAAFVASLNPDATTGAVDMTALAAALPPAPPNAPADGLTRLMDKDGDGVVTASDLNAFFAVLDADGDGALSQSELAPPMGGHGPGGDHGGPGAPGAGGPQGAAPGAHAVAGMLAHAADADKSGDVTADEWTAFLASLNADAATGDVDMTALLAALEAARPQQTRSKALKKVLKRVKRAAKSGQDPSALIVQLLDHDGDGTVEISDIQWFFDMADGNADGALDQIELHPKR